MTSNRAMRASDHDREQAAEVLGDAYAVGRVDLDEFHDRAGAAYSAKTWGELRDLTRTCQPSKSLWLRSVRPHAFRDLATTCMRADYSWIGPGQDYLDLYQHIQDT